jgi:hypothetical protein
VRTSGVLPAPLAGGFSSLIIVTAITFVAASLADGDARSLIGFDCGLGVACDETAAVSPWFVVGVDGLVARGTGGGFACRVLSFSSLKSHSTSSCTGLIN